MSIDNLDEHDDRPDPDDIDACDPADDEPDEPVATGFTINAGPIPNRHNEPYPTWSDWVDPDSDPDLGMW